VIALESSKLFSRLPAAELKSLAAAAKEMRFGPGQEIFKEGDPSGKAHVFKSLGYGPEHAEQLAGMYQEQGAAKFANNEYTLGKLDQHGQRIDIEIKLKGIGDNAGKVSNLKSGWMIKPDGSISLNTPFSGFTQ